MRGLLTLLAVLTMSGCATIEMERERFRSVKLGMNKEQVFNIMKQPKKASRWGKETHYSWDDVVVVLESGKVVNKSSLELHQKYLIEAESFLGTLPNKKIAKILPSVKGMTKDDLEFGPVKNIVANILKENGYEISEDENKIDTIVFVNFGVSDPRTETKTWTEPVYEYVTEQPQQSSTTHNIYNQYGQNLGQVQSNTSYGNPYAVAVPKRVYRGERTNSVTITKYISHFILEAANYDHFKKNKTNKNYWKVITISEGNSNDLRRKLPYLGIIAKQLVEFDSRGKQKGYVYANDPRADFLSDDQTVPLELSN